MLMPSLFFRLVPWFGRKNLDAKNKQHNSSPGNISNTDYKNKQFSITIVDKVAKVNMHDKSNNMMQASTN